MTVETVNNEAMIFDVIIVGAGPSGLSAAIRLKQLKPDLHVCVLEKGAEVGAHILSGAVIETRALDELLPNWRELNAPISQIVTKDAFFYLTKSAKFQLPTPKSMKNHGNYIISLSQLCRWLAVQAESLGVEIYAGFPAADLVYDDRGCVKGVITTQMGIDKKGEKTLQFQPGMHLYATHTLLAEGVRGSLSKKVITQFDLTKNSEPQTYGLGLKEIWQVKSSAYKAGMVWHSVGWPLSKDTYGGSFVYHLEDNKVSIGFVVGLDYQNPWLDPFAEFQRFKTHPFLKELLEGGERIAYGAKSLVEGGIQSLPKLNFPGGLLIGDAAGFLNVPKIKGTHTAMKSGMIAAEVLISGEDYLEKIKDSWLWEELYSVRNIRPSFKYGLWSGLAYSFVDQYVLNAKTPWTLPHHGADHTQLKLSSECQKIDYPKPDGKLSFDRSSSLYLSGTFHTENQPCHLVLQDKEMPIDYNLKNYAAPETRYCPAGVYEIVNHQLQINAQNCLHCKTCDIKDPTQNITWTSPEGGGGPRYSEM